MHRPVRGFVATLTVLALLTACSNSTESSTQTTNSTSASSAAPADDEPVAATPMLASTVSQPIPVTATDGKVHLAYELYLTNAMGQQVDLESVAVKAGDRTLLSLSGDELKSRTRILGANDTPTTTFGPAQGGAVWLDVVVDGAVPKDLAHEITVKLTKPMPPLLPEMTTEDVAHVAVSDRTPIVISPPLDGPNWLDGDSCCAMTAHRMALNPINGRLWAAERFAIDYLQLSDDGTAFSGDVTKLESFGYFGADIHAVADGPVVAVLDGLPEQVPGKGPTGLKLEEYGGNHVVQDIGNGNYAFYAHLKTGSVAVKPGDQLTRGQVLGNLGNSGNTDAPHLHFHVMSTPDPLMADGLPFVFDSFTLDGQMASIDALDPLLNGAPAALAGGFAPREETDVSPLVLDVMSYALG